MAMRPSALFALLLVAVVGCGVPEAPSVAQTKPTPKPEIPKPVEPPKTPAQKPVDEDPAKLGLVIHDTKVGTGNPAMPGDTCYMKYAGRLKSNGKEFDSTAKNGDKPFSFQLGSGQVIKGWDLGVKGMKPGGKRTLDIPAALAYGSEAKDAIPANSDLIFDIELLGTVKAEDANTVVREIVKPGSGPLIKTGDVVSIKYIGRLADGTIFDSTDKSNKGKPIQFKLGSGAISIQGFNAAIEGLRPGAVAIATIPPALGFGPRPVPGVPENAILKFEITVVKVN